MKHLVCTLCCILLIFEFFVEFFYIKDSYFVQLFLLAVNLTVFIFIHSLKIGICDACIILLGFYGLFMPSINSINTNLMLIELYKSIFCYFILRYIFTYYPKYASCILCAYTLGIFILEIISLYVYYLFSTTIYNSGLVSLYDLRFLYTPLGIPSNAWNSFQWLFGGILAVAYFYVKNTKIKMLAAITGYLILCQLLLSFSRGIYLSLLVFVIIFFLFEKKRLFIGHEKILLSSCAIFIIGVCIIYPNEIEKVFEFNKTVSQQRSIEGRVKSISVTFDVLQKYPWGVGLNNYTLAKDYYLVGDERVDSYTTYAPNIISKLLVELGYCGGFIYSMLCVSIIILLIKRKDRKLWIISLFLTAFFVREQTFSTMFDSKITLLLIFLLIAYLQRNEPVYDNEKKYKDIFRFLPFIVVTYIVWQFIHIRSSRESIPIIVNQAFHFRNKNPEKSLFYFEKASKKNQLDIQLSFYVYLHLVNKGDILIEELKKWTFIYPDKLIFKWELYQKYRREGFVNEAVEMFVFAILQEPNILRTSYWKELQFSDKEFFEQVENSLQIHISQAPSDPINLAKYGSIAMQLDDYETAELYLVRSNAQLPNLPKVWFNMACIYERKGLVNKANQCICIGKLIEQGIFPDENYIPTKSINIKDLIWNQYRFLFKVWYKTTLEI